MSDPRDSGLTVSAEPGQHEIVITRIFDAPPELVFRTYTDPELIPKWWGMRNTTTEVDSMDVRPGGVWRYVNRDAQGGEHGFHGVYHEVAAPGRLVHTFEYEGIPGHVLLETVTFEDIGDGRTRLVDQSVFQSIDDRDGMLKSGVEVGAADTFDRLAELLAKA